MDTDTIVRVELYRALDENFSYTLKCWVGYDRFGNMIATVDEKRAEKSRWLKRVLDRDNYVQTHSVARDMYARQVEAGRRLARRTS